MSEQSAPSAATNGGVRATNGGVRRRAPGAGRPIGSRSHRVTMRETLVRAYADQLGGLDRIGPILMTDIERAVDMLLLAQAARAKLAAGRTSITEVCRLEGHADRAVRRLALSPPRTHSLAPSLRDYLAGSATEEG
jgi:hypothetical protein